MPKVFAARVKNVLSGDTLVLSPLNGSSHQERVLSLAYIQAPRLTSNERYGFESRELLRKLLLGKEIRFWVLYKSQNEHEFGDVSSPIFPSLIQYILERGGARMRDRTDDSEEVENFLSVQEKAKAKKAGIWGDAASPAVVDRTEVDFNTAYAGIVERVISGDRIMARILLSASSQCVTPLLIAGIRAPRTAYAEEAGEPFGEQARSFVETRLLGRDVQVTVLGESQSGVLVGKLVHPSGNISDKILGAGLAEVSDWQSELVGVRGMGFLRKAEKQARLAGKGKWAADKENTETVALGEVTVAPGKTLSATVSRVISADTLELSLKSGAPVSVQLAFLRGPRNSDPATAPFVNDAREFVREKTIGKQVQVTVESIRPGNEQYEDRAMVTIVLPSKKNLSELVVSHGYATVLRHRNSAELAPEYFDELIEEETAARKKKVGIFGKAPDVGRVVDASETAAKAKPYLFSFQNRGRISGVVEHIMSASRYRISIPREGVRIVLVLGGLNNIGKDDATAKPALEYANKKAYQRDVSIEVYNTDRIGGFIGNMYLPGSNAPFQVALLEKGFAQIHERSLNQTKNANLLTEAEEKAKAARLGVWKNYTEKSVESVTEQVSKLTISRKYLDAQVTEVLKDGTLAIQLMNAEQAKLKPFMQKLHASTASFPKLTHAPRRNEIVAAKFSQNGKYYRAKVLGKSETGNKYDIQQIDYGSVEVVASSDLLSLPAQYGITTYKPQAHVIQLSLIALPSAKNQPEYHDDCLYYLEDTLLEKQQVACVTYNNPAPGVEWDVELYDVATISKDPSRTVNKDLIEKGLALVKKRDLAPFEHLLKTESQDLLRLEAEARREHKGCWEFGDIEDDDDE